MCVCAGGIWIRAIPAQRVRFVIFGRGGGGGGMVLLTSLLTDPRYSAGGAEYRANYAQPKGEKNHTHAQYTLFLNLPLRSCGGMRKIGVCV